MQDKPHPHPYLQDSKQLLTSAAAGTSPPVGHSRTSHSGTAAHQQPQHPEPEAASKQRSGQGAVKSPTRPSAVPKLNLKATEATEAAASSSMAAASSCSRDGGTRGSGRSRATVGGHKPSGLNDAPAARVAATASGGGPTSSSRREQGGGGTTQRKPWGSSAASKPAAVVGSARSSVAGGRSSPPHGSGAGGGSGRGPPGSKAEAQERMDSGSAAGAVAGSAAGSAAGSTLDRRGSGAGGMTELGVLMELCPADAAQLSRTLAFFTQGFHRWGASVVMMAWCSAINLASQTAHVLVGCDHLQRKAPGRTNI